MIATSFERLGALFWCLSVVEAYPNSDNLDRGQVNSTGKFEGSCIFQDGGDNTDCHVLLQNVVQVAKNDPAMHPMIASKDGVHVARSNSQRNRSEGSNKFWAHPLVLGILLGLFLIGPDHLGTLMALSTLTSGFDSFKRGFCWGFGHSIGVMLLCPIFLLIEHLTSKTMSRDTWEYYGDIFIGVSMFAVGSYFMCYQDAYLYKRKDGTYVAKGCACHAHSSCTGHTMPMPTSITTSHPEMVNSEEVADNSISRLHFASNAFLGVLQGFCCPIGMTVGTGFMSRVTATASTPMLLAFIAEFILASSVSSGTIAVVWGVLTINGSGCCISGRFVYIATCLSLQLFGIVWLVAHSLGVLEHIDFGNKIHEKLMPA